MNNPRVQSLALLLLGLVSCKGPEKKDPDLPIHPSSKEVLDSGFRRVTTIEEAERKNVVLDPRLGDNPIPFGFIHKDWLEFKSKLQPGDVLIEFYTPPATEEMIHGFGGYEIIRNGKVIATLITQT